MVADMLGMAGHQVRMAGDAAGLRRQLARQPADLIVLDLTLPDEDGLAVARWLRTLAVEPGIVMLTGLGDSIDRVAGLEAGADDYIAKPFEPRELTARIEAVLRRRRPDTPPLWRLGPWRLGPLAETLLHDDGRAIRVTPGELQLLQAFARQPGDVLSRDQLLELAPARDDDPFDRSIDHRIVRLRRRIEIDPRHPQLIVTARGRGYLYRP
jgi:DNA-binding response OmpR family regulator